MTPRFGLRKSLLRAASLLAIGSLFFSRPLIGSGRSDGGESLTGFHLSWVWSGPGAWLGKSGLEIVDLDGDGSKDLLMTSWASSFSDGGYWSQWELDGDLHQVWTSLPYRTGPRAVRSFETIAGREIAVATADSIEILDGRSRQQVEVIPTASSQIRSFAIADLDLDSQLELVVCDDAALYLYDLASATLLDTRYGFGCTDIDVGQIDDDPQLEIALAGNPQGGFVLDGSSLAVDYEDPAGFGPFVRLVDLLGVGRDQVVGGTNSGTGLRARDPADGATLWEVPGASVGAILGVDLGGGPAEELVWGDLTTATIRVLEGSDGQELWSLPSPETDIAALTAGDLDGDGTIDLAWATVRSIFVADTATHLVKSSVSDLGEPLVGLAGGDLDGDGSIEIGTAVSGDASSEVASAILELDQRTGRLKSVGPVEGPRPLNSLSGFAAAQIDADRELEICLTSRDYYPSGALACYDGRDFSLQWWVDFPDLYPAQSLLAAQLDSDPAPELVVTSGPWLYAFEAETGWLKWRTPRLGTFGGFDLLRAGDLTGDGQTEILAAASSDEPYIAKDIATVEGRSGAPVFPVQQASTSSLDLGHLHSDLAPDLVLGRADGEVAIFDPKTGTLQPPEVMLDGPVEALRIFDVTRDGVPDIVARVDDHLEVFDGALRAVVWTSPFLGSPNGQRDVLLAADLDGDTVPEIVAGTGYGFVLFEAPLVALFGDGFEAGDTSAWSETVP